MKIPSNFCVAPFIQLTTHPTGSFSPCPYLGGTTWRTRGKIKEKWQGLELETLRESFLNNEQNPICNRCWQEESIGKDSLRLRMLKEYTVDLDNYKSAPKILSIKNGNICNAKCRSCHPQDSTPWIQDANKLHEITKKQFYSLNYDPNNWTDDQVDEIIALLPYLERLELYGGEPLYNKKVIDILQAAIDSEDSKHITLYLNTNGSVNLIERLPDVKSFKHFDLCVSIDALDEQFSYVRHPLKYHEIETHVKQWKHYFKSNQVSYSMKPIVTVSILNILTLSEIKSRLNQLFDIDPFWILLTDPSHLCISNLPEPIKEVAINKLKHDSTFDNFINFMQQTEFREQPFRDFFEIIEGLDQIRGENFEETFPELFKLLNPLRLEPLGIRLFVGVTNNLELIRYETFKRVNLNEGDDFPIHHIKGDKNVVTITEVDGVQHMVLTKNLAEGIYFTSKEDWDSEETFEHVKSKAKKLTQLTV